MAKKILIADDAEDVKLVVQLFLESKGFDILTAYDGLDALDKARNDRPDLILLDVMMPVLDGFDVCKKLKADPKTASIPVVMLSASAQAESKQRGMEAGAEDYLVKPFQPEALDALIHQILD
jgi:DNA-binding response OmpR family regulator